MDIKSYVKFWKQYSMRQNWSYRKLGDICSIERGGSPRPITDYITDSADGINWIKIGDATEGSKYITSTKEKIKPEGMKKSRFVHKGDFILSNSMSFGRPYILGVDGCIHDGWLVIHDDDCIFDKDYLYYLLSSPVMFSKFKQLAVGGVVNNLNSTLVKNVVVPIPVKKVQQTIASEFDKIKGLIALKNKQLQDLDLLSQTIFFDMFGDPAENKNGWILHRFDEVFDLQMGKTPDRKTPKYFGGDNVWVSIRDMVGKEISDSNEHITDDAVIATNIRKVKKGTVIMSFKLTVGKCAIAAKDLYTNEAIMAFNLKEGYEVNSDFLYFYLQVYKWEGANKAVMGLTLNKATISMQKIGFPPLSDQQEFAKRIDVIERQKQHIYSTIKDLETILASRMQYWFE